MTSALYEGVVHHARFRPRRHAFAYRVFMPYLDLAEIPALFEGDLLFGTGPLALARFRREDHLGEAHEALDATIRTLVDARLGFRPDGAIRLLTHLRYFGHGFNPVSFYYCHDRSDALVAIVAEVSNTPWNEMHAYVLDARGTSGGTLVHRFGKAFHVSPFHGLAQTYEWSFHEPGEALAVHMRNLEGGEPVFEAGMRLERRAWTRANARRMLVRYPAMTLQVVSAIYFEAARLALLGTPFHSHPKHRIGTLEPSA